MMGQRTQHWGTMEHDQTMSPHEAPAVNPETQRASRGNTLLMILSIVVAVDTLFILMLGVAVGFLWGEQSSRVEDTSYAPSAEEQEIWMFADQMATDVGYFIVDNDLKAYLNLYNPDDPHVDLASAESEFADVAQKAQEGEGAVEYMSDTMPIVYEDESTGETIVRVTISGMNPNSGRPAGGRLTLHILYNDGDMTLTGREGRELKRTGTIW